MGYLGGRGGLESLRIGTLGETVLGIAVIDKVPKE